MKYYKRDDLLIQNHKLKSEIKEIKKIIHYPDCWDLAAYPTLIDAITEIYGGCREDNCKHKNKESVPECYSAGDDEGHCLSKNSNNEVCKECNMVEIIKEYRKSKKVKK